MDSKVELALMSDDSLLVKVSSQIKPGRKSSLYVNNVSRMTNRELKKNVAISAGALAEHLCETYGDTFDPSRIAKDSLEVLYELMTDEAVKAWQGEGERFRPYDMTHDEGIKSSKIKGP